MFLLPGFTLTILTMDSFRGKEEQLLIYHNESDVLQEKAQKNPQREEKLLQLDAFLYPIFLHSDRCSRPICFIKRDTQFHPPCLLHSDGQTTFAFRGTSQKPFDLVSYYRKTNLQGQKAACRQTDALTKLRLMVSAFLEKVK